MLRRFASIGLLLFASAAFAQESKNGFVEKSHKNADGTESKYVVFVPHEYDGKKEYPIILFLHGSGETKGDRSGKMPVEQGIGPHLKRNEKSFPAFVVFPQSEKRTWKAESDDGKRAMAMLETTMKEFKVDSKRVCLTGISMGGNGTWSFAAAYPEKWCCFVPICGWGDAKDAEKIKDIPCWCWHGDQDSSVKVDKSREMIEALKKAGGKPIYTELANVAHNSWDAAYATPDVVSWMMKQKK